MDSVDPNAAEYGAEPASLSPTSVDLGLSAAQPFQFACERCGHCCTAGSGFVWVEDDEVDRLADRLGLTRGQFLDRMTRTVVDPASGVMRLSLRETNPGTSGGQCVLLEGRSHCTVYDDRPKHCADFPYWPSVMSGGTGFESARSICPGIQVVVDSSTREAAFERLRALYEELEAEINALSPRCELSGLCCRFEEAGHELWATALETDYALSQHPELSEPEAPGRCPYHVGGRCTAREGRALGCRTYFCDERTTDTLEDVHERYLRRVRDIERELGYPAAYSAFPAALATRSKAALKRSENSSADLGNSDSSES
ncbi:MAG: Fe-S-cluster containining protein [Planctomycetota bacterium]|jgi:Fe-S-cluster containining protein